MAVSLMTDADFGAHLASGAPTVVKFYADWCGSCKLFSPKFRRMSEEETNAGIAFVDVNAEENPAARSLASIDNLPYFAVFKDGQLVAGLATSKEEVVRELLDQIR
jgi:thiol-disulfide isomerase/thioredoxin